MNAEEVFLSSEMTEEDVSSWDSQPEVRRFAQLHRHVPGYQRLVILEGSRLRLERRRGKALDRQYIHMGILDPEPARKATLPRWQLGVLGLGMALFGLTLGFDGFGLFGSQLELAGILALLGMLVVGAAWLAVRGYRREVVFHSQHGRVPLLRLVENVPDVKTFQEFVAQLRSAAQQSRGRLPRDQAQFLVEELKEHRRLAEAGGIEQPAYDAAKARILSCH